MKKDTWAEYYKATAGRAPRKPLVEAVEYTKNKGVALDMGAGDLTDSIFLLDQGFLVTAIDSSPSSESLAKTINKTNFVFLKESFDQFHFESNRYDLISAQLALPFSEPQTFNNMFEELKKSLKVGGIFTGQFFGVRDEWNKPESKMTFHTKKEAELLFSDMKIIKLFEDEKDGKTASGDKKHWHVFNVIAEKI